MSNHGLVLLAVARNPQARIREISTVVGITDRACHRILNDLVGAGYVVRRRVGRRNEYGVDVRRPMRHPIVREHPVAELLGVLTPQS